MKALAWIGILIGFVGFGYLVGFGPEQTDPGAGSSLFMMLIGAAGVFYLYRHYFPHGFIPRK
ncbi:hypothetical protein J2S73_002882 [Amorphus orientalis]|uniref:Uncharacterized protein n=1 Tax=Amorphus orientalis TaxID=649198 RepID=A0AAE4ATQ0_9HYPH|nr:hypothetical protein [Amorphus orientalis]